MQYPALRGVTGFCLALWAACANADFGEYQSHTVLGQAIQVDTSVGKVRLTAVDDAGIYVHYVEEGIKQLPSFALDDDIAAHATVVTESADSIEFSVSGLTATISKSPVSIAFSRDGESLVTEEHGYFAKETIRGFRFALDDDEKIMGGGQRVLGMDRRGHRLPLYNKAHYGYTTESYQMYYGLPAVMSSDRYVIVFDNSATGHLDIGKTEPDVLQFEAVGGRTAYLVVAGDSFPALINNYTDVTGKQPLPPRWAFGNFASRFGYRTEKETREVVKKFKRAKIPLDAVVLDLYWFGPEIQGYMGNLDWDRNAFPNAEDMISDFSKQGVQTITITEPFVLKASDKWQEAVDNDVFATSVTGGPRRFDFYFGNTGLIDVFSEKGRNWFAKAYDRLLEQGVTGSWGDLGEPEVHPGDSLHWLSDVGIEATGDEVHNAFGHRWAQMVYENQVQKYPDMRPVIMMRSGFAGSQRYGMIPWTGDVSRSWGGLKPQVELSLSMGLLGLAYNHSDLGGFAGGEEFIKEMYIRWLQYGVFQPVYRPHAQEEIPPEPVFHDKETQDIVRDYIRLRYKLLPYIYTLAYENSTTGMPLMRPVFFEDENNTDLIAIKDTYLWGDAFLVKPITDPDLDSVSIDLPEGVWFNYWTEERHEGGQSVDMPMTLRTLPIMVRGGSFIPMTQGIQTTRDYSSEKLTLHYFADASIPEATGQMYEDDGRSRLSLAEGNFELLSFRATQNGDALKFVFDQTGGSYAGQPEVRDIRLIIHNVSTPPSEVRVGDETLKIRNRERKNSAFWHKDTRTLTVRFHWDHSNLNLSIR